METKKITIVVPAYNAAKYLGETLYSIHVQTVKPYEVIIVNDCSTDNTLLIAEACGKLYFHDIKFSITQHRRNMGIGASRQHGAEDATGNYVAFLSSDDVYHPEFLEESLKQLDRNYATFTDYWRCNEKLEATDIFASPYFERPDQFNILAINWALQKNMFVNFSSVIIPKNYFKKVSFLEELRHGEDLIFLLDTILADLKWTVIRKPLLNYRIHRQQGTVLYHQKAQEIAYLWMLTANRLLQIGVPRDVVDLSVTTNLQSYLKRQSPAKRVLRKCLRFMRMS